MMGWNWGDMMNWRWGWGGMMFGGVGMVLFWVLLIVLVVWGVRALTGDDGRATSASGTMHNDTGDGERPSALEILQARYARGEINRDEYETMRTDLAMR